MPSVSKLMTSRMPAAIERPPMAFPAGEPAREDFEDSLSKFHMFSSQGTSFTLYFKESKVNLVFLHTHLAQDGHRLGVRRRLSR